MLDIMNHLLLGSGYTVLKNLKTLNERVDDVIEGIKLID